MKKRLGNLSLILIKFTTVLFIFFSFSNPVLALEDYTDNVSEITGAKQEEGIINIYLFYSETCPHCEKEIKFLDDLIGKYPDDLALYKYEVLSSQKNYQYFLDTNVKLGVSSDSVPYTVIGDTVIIGYSDQDTQGAMINQAINKYNPKLDLSNTFKLPLLGKVDAKTTSISLVAIVLGLVDGFNPCAMWVLLFLINLLIGNGNHQKMRILGLAFLLTSAFIYFLSMLGLNLVLNLALVRNLQIFIALIAIILGIVNLNNYRIEKDKDSGCLVVDREKRKNLYTKFMRYIKEPNIFIAIIGMMILAISVNAIELACSLGFPVIFSQILAINQIDSIARIGYLLIYTFFYMLDDMIVFLIALKTFSATGISTKFNKYSHLVGGILMLIMGLLFIFKPEWIMMNF